VHSHAFVDSDEMLCRFGGATIGDGDEKSGRGVAPASFVSSSELECIVPRPAAGRARSRSPSRSTAALIINPNLKVRKAAQ